MSSADDATKLAEAAAKAASAEKDLKNNAADANAALQNQTPALQKAKEGFEQIKEAIRKSVETIQEFTKEMTDAGNALSDGSEISENSAKALGLLSTKIFDVSTAYNTMVTAGSSGYQSMTSQVQEVFKSIDGIPNGLNKLREAATKILGEGAVSNIMKEAGSSTKALGNALQSNLMLYAESADNANKLRAGVISLMGASGGLDKLYQQSGSNLQNLNNVLSEHENALQSLSEEAGISKSTAVELYMQMGKIPGALNQVIRASDESEQKITYLSAAAKIATATGREYSSVVSDLAVAFDQYNISGEKALVFTARSTELSSNLQTNFQNVHNYMTQTAKSFALIGNNAEASAKLVNSLGDSLRGTGISGASAINIVENITQKISGMTLAQKAFLSSQTGGRGGLTGGYEIDLMLRKGQLDEVFNKVKQTLTRQFGSIATLEEAARSPQAAARLTQQTAILTKGPLAIAGNQGEAYRILEAFKNGQTSGFKELANSSQLLGKNLDNGTNLQQKTVSVLEKNRDGIERLRGQGSLVAQNLFEKNATVEAGGDIQQYLEMTRRTSQARGVGAAERSSEYIVGDRLRTNVGEGVHDVGSLLGFTSKKLTDAMSNFMQSATSHDKNYLSSRQAVMNEIQQKEEIVKYLPNDSSEKRDLLDQINKYKNNIATLDMDYSRGLKGGDMQNFANLIKENKRPASNLEAARAMRPLKFEPMTIKVVVEQSGKITTTTAEKQLHIEAQSPTPRR